MKSFSKKTWIRLTSIIAVLFFLFFIFNKKPSVTAEDKTYISAFLKEWHISVTPDQVHQNFETELAFISKVQDSIVAHIQHKEIGHDYFGNVKYYYTNREGFCYDRSVLMEKIFAEYGFNFRHIFVYYNPDYKKETSIADFYKKGTQSHALSEIETKNGWMAIGTNCNWIAQTKSGEIFNISRLKEYVRSKQVIAFKKEPCIGKVFWHDYPKFQFVYGVYSRKGNFFSPHIPIPEINIKMLFYNL